MGHDYDEAGYQTTIAESLATADSDGLKYTHYTRDQVAYDRAELGVDGKAVLYIREFAVLPDEIVDFVRESQPKAWSQLVNRMGGESSAGKRLWNAVKNAMDDRGSLSVLQAGLKVDGVDISVVKYPSARGDEESSGWRNNRFVVLEELEYDQNQIGNHHGRLDLTLFVNGVPIVTCELKNLLTGQTVQNGIEQYEKDRSPKARLLSFPYRALVHFVADKERVFMTTRLAHAETRWFPFDQGHNGAAGNPPAKEGKYRSSYLWEEVWRPKNLLQLLRHFIVLDPPEDESGLHTARDLLQNSILKFPRYHQRRAVLKMIDHARTEGVGGGYLIQHSTGSGKTLTIGWLAHQLKGQYVDGTKLFDQVIVVSDRRIIHKQLCDLVESLTSEKTKTADIVARTKSSSDLADALKDKTPIVVSTVHGFWYAQDKVAKQKGRRFAVLIDEGHRSQDGKLNAKMESVLNELGSGQASNVSMFAFTATPTDTTLQRFGKKIDGPAGWEPHDLYSMMQARSEGFIVDVLKDYTFFSQMGTATAIGDPDLLVKKGATNIRELLASDERMIRMKAKVIVRHFLNDVRWLLKGNARAMLICVNQAAAYRYWLAMQEELKSSEHKFVRARLKRLGLPPTRVAIAFSGSHKQRDESGIERVYQEGPLNGNDKEGHPIEGERIATAMSTTHHLLIAVNKFQTGYDEPKLMAMYVDKGLNGINAVQTLSRLNRMHKGKGQHRFRNSDPDPVSPKVLDFYNEAADISSAFKEYQNFVLPKKVIPGDILEDLAGRLDEFPVYTADVLDQVWDLWKKRKGGGDDPAINELVQQCFDRFKAIPCVDDQLRFRYLARKFLSLWNTAHEIVTRELDKEVLSIMRKRLQLLTFLLTRLEVWTKGDAAIPIDPKDYVDLTDLELGEGVRAVLSPSPQTEIEPPTEIKVQDPKKERLKTLEEVVNAFNEKHGGTQNLSVSKSENSDSKVDHLELLKKMVEDAAAAAGRTGGSGYESFRKQFEKQMRQAFLGHEDPPQSLEDFFEYLLDEDPIRWANFIDRIALRSHDIEQGAA